MNWFVDSSLLKENFIVFLYAQRLQFKLWNCALIEGDAGGNKVATIEGGVGGQFFPIVVQDAPVTISFERVQIIKYNNSANHIAIFTDTIYKYDSKTLRCLKVC